MKDCLFCKIIDGTIPSTKIYEDDYTYAFEDTSPQAPIHVLVIPKKHVANLIEAKEGLSQKELWALISSCSAVAKIKGLETNGFRIVSNCGDDGCQSVQHLHFHVLGGKALSAQMA